MKQIYVAPEMQAMLLAATDVITASIDSTEDGFDGGIVDLNPTT